MTWAGWVGGSVAGSWESQMERIMEARTHMCPAVVCVLPFRVPYQKAFVVIIFATMVHAFSILPVTLFHYYLFAILPCSSGFPCGSAGEESACNAGDLDSIPELGRSLGEGKGYPLQYSGLENSMDYTRGVTKSQTRLSDFHSLTHSLFFIPFLIPRVGPSSWHKVDI